MIPLIAWRNVWRNRVRSLVVITSVVVGIWAAAFIISFSIGMKQGYVRTAIKDEVSHIQVHMPGYLQNPDLARYIPQAGLLIRRIRRIPEVKAVTGRLLLEAMASTATNTAGVILRGIDTEAENQVTGIRDHIIAGSYLSGRELPVLVGSALAGKLNLKLGHKLVLTFQDSGGNITAAAFRVCGIFRTANSSFDESNLFVQAGDLDPLIREGDRTAEIAVLLRDEDSVLPVQQTLQAMFPKTEVENWRQIAPELALMVDTQDESLYLILLIIVAALMFGIINTMLMAVLERFREIAMLMAIGMKRSRLFGMIMMETLYLSGAGIPLGLGVSYLSIRILARSGIDLGHFAQGLSAYGFGTIIYPQMKPQFYWLVCGFIFLAALLGSLFPAARALKVEPSKALQSQ